MDTDTNHNESGAPEKAPTETSKPRSGDQAPRSTTSPKNLKPVTNELPKSAKDHSSEFQDTSNGTEASSQDIDSQDDTSNCTGVNLETSPENFQDAREFQSAEQRRSITLSGLPALTSLKEIVNIIRGGAILNIHGRPDGRVAFATFVDPSAAEAFIDYAQKTPLSISGKNVGPSFPSSLIS